MIFKYGPSEQPRTAATPAVAGEVQAVSALALQNSVLGLLQDRCQRRQDGTLGDVLGLPTGFARLDRLLNGLQTGLYILAGAPSVGKTTFLVQLADQLAAASDVPVLLVTFENPQENLVIKSLARTVRRDCLDLERGRVPWPELERAWERWTPCAKRVHYAEGGPHVTVAWLERQARALQAQGGGRCVILLDYLQKMLVNIPGGTSKEKADTLAMALRGLSRDLDVPLLAVSSQSRQGYQGGGGPRVATLATLKESGEIEYSADVVLHLRPCEPNEPRAQQQNGRVRPVWLDIEKNRYGDKGEVPLAFHAALASFYEEGSEHAG
jgi:replicative DNA helicase